MTLLVFVPISLKGVEDGKGIGQVETVDHQVEQAGDPGAPQQAHQHPHPLHVGHHQLPGKDNIKVVLSCDRKYSFLDGTSLPYGGQ